MKDRQCGIELLRIVSMLMVLVLHANFIALPRVTAESIFSVESISRCLIQSACIIAVNVFVMISGWFGIRTSLRGFCNFLWQVIYIVGISYLVEWVFFNQQIVPKDFLRLFGLYNGGGWFVASYIGLYILAPVLNSYIEKTSIKNITITLALFFGFEFIWGNTLSVEFVLGGYSTFSFIGIYILGGMLHKIQIKLSPKLIVHLFLSLVFINTMMYITTVRFNMIALRDTIYNYINPLVIAGASTILLLFVKSKVNKIGGKKKRFILWCASSCFAVYLLHVGTTYAFTLYCDQVRSIYNEFGTFRYFIILLYITLVFTVAILVDQPRKLIWHKCILPLFSPSK